MIVYLARDIPPFVMYCVYGESGSSLLIESTDSMIEMLTVPNCAEVPSNRASAGSSVRLFIVNIARLRGSYFGILHMYTGVEAISVLLEQKKKC